MRMRSSASAPPPGGLSTSPPPLSRGTATTRPGLQRSSPSPLSVHTAQLSHGVACSGGSAPGCARSSWEEHSASMKAVQRLALVLTRWVRTRLGPEWACVTAAAVVHPWLLVGCLLPCLPWPLRLVGAPCAAATQAQSAPDASAGEEQGHMHAHFSRPAPPPLHRVPGPGPDSTSSPWRTMRTARSNPRRRLMRAQNRHQKQPTSCHHCWSSESGA
jgi:hypothetical protein